MGEKKRALTSRLRHQSSPLHRSLTKGTEEKWNDLAKVCYRDILTFCGELYHQFPNEMARDLLFKGHESILEDGSLHDGLLGDEILVQLMKHTTANEDLKSLGRAWKLLLLAAKTFPP